MPFDEKVRKKVLLWCDRHCCLCRKPCGINIEVHHLTDIIQYNYAEHEVGLDKRDVPYFMTN